MQVFLPSSTTALVGLSQSSLCFLALLTTQLSSVTNLDDIEQSLNAI